MLLAGLVWFLWFPNFVRLTLSNYTVGQCRQLYLSQLTLRCLQKVFMTAQDWSRRRNSKNESRDHVNYNVVGTSNEIITLRHCYGVLATSSRPFLFFFCCNFWFYIGSLRCGLFFPSKHINFESVLKQYWSSTFINIILTLLFVWKLKLSQRILLTLFQRLKSNIKTTLTIFVAQVFTGQ